MISLSPELDKIIRQNLRDESAYDLIRDLIERERDVADQQATVLKRLHRLSTAQYDSLHSMFTAYLEVGCDIFKLPRGSVNRINDPSYVPQTTVPHSEMESNRYELKDMLCKHVVAQDQTVSYANVHDHHPSPRPDSDQYTVCYIGTPIRVENAFWGSLCFYSDQPHPTEFTEIETEFIEFMAQSIGSAIDTYNNQRQRQIAEERYRLIFENIDTPIIMYDVDSYQVIDVNTSATQFYGYTREEFRTLSMVDINMLPPSDIEAKIQASHTEGLPYTRFPHRLKLGEIREVEDYSNDMLMDNRRLRVSIIYDYSDRHAAEEALKHSEANLRAIFDNASQLLFLVDDTANIIAMNRAANELMKLTDDPHETADDSLYRFHRTTDRYLVSDYISQALNGNSISHDVFITLTNNKPLYITYRYVPVKTPDEEIIGVCVTGQDVTSLKLSEQQLSRERNILRTLIDNLPDSIYIKDANAQLLTANRRYLEVARVNSIDDLLGKTDIEIYPQFGDQYYQDDLQVIREGTIINKDEPMILPDGSESIFSTIKIPLRDSTNKIVGLVGVGHDITQQRKIEQGLRDNEEKFTQLITHIPETFWIYDIETQNIIYASDNYERLFGISLEDRQRDQNLLLAQVHPDDRATVAHSLNNQSEGKSSVYEVRFANSETTYRWVHLRNYSVLNDEGVPYRIAGIASDITKQKQAEADKLEMLAQQERINILSTFFRDASHEFKTPLSVINASLYILDKTGEPATREHHHNIIRDQVRGISELIEMLLLMSRLDSHADLSFMAVNVNSIISQLDHTVRATYAERAGDFQFKFGQDLPPILGHLTHITQAVKNLIDNAVRYSQPGEVIQIQTYQSSDRVVIEIRDHGIGISDDELPRIFNRFYRRDEAHSTRGFGLGLPIAQSIAHRHGGDITVDTKLGRGSRFKLLFPTIRVER